MEQESMAVPPWLDSLLSTQFFRVCSRHVETPRNECNMFCFHCQNGAFCFYCKSSIHKGHPVIQIRRSSYHDVVRVSEIQDVLDVGEIQTYVINSARVVFLNERPQPRSSNSGGGGSGGGGHGGKTASHFCETCRRSLLDSFRFCSLGCKVAGIRKKKMVRGEVDSGSSEEGCSSAGSKKRNEGRLPAGEGMHKGTHPPTHGSNSTSRRRKGIPQRAPFGSSLF